MRSFHKIARKGLLAACLLGLGLTLAPGCGSSVKPMDYQPENEYPSGPGLFSGPEGEFTVLSIEKGPPPAEPRPEEDLPAEP